MSQKINSNWKTGGRIPATSPKKRGTGLQYKSTLLFVNRPVLTKDEYITRYH